MAKALTEAQWLKSNETYALIRYLQQHRRITKVRGGRRRLRLFSCACCRLVWDLFEDERCRRTIEVAERAADGKASKQELAHAHEEAQKAELAAQKRMAESSRPRQNSPAYRRAGVAYFLGSAAHSAATSLLLGDFAGNVSSSIYVAAQWAAQLNGTDEKASMRLTEIQQCQLVRDIFGNPFRPRPTVDPAWLSWNGDVVLRMAQTIYDERRFDGMPVLADALEDAGCTSAEILEHCHGKAEHARGCWVVDLLLGKQ